jgi:hypothetical protein
LVQALAASRVNFISLQALAVVLLPQAASGCKRFWSWSVGADISDLQTLACQLETIKEVFELFDTDGQHQLDEEELACAIYTLGFSQKGHVQVVFLHFK